MTERREPTDAALDDIARIVGIIGVQARNLASRHIGRTFAGLGPLVEFEPCDDRPECVRLWFKDGNSPIVPADYRLWYYRELPQPLWGKLTGP